MELVDPTCGLLLSAGLLKSETYYGHEGLLVACAEALAAWESAVFELDRIRVVDERAALLGRLMAARRVGETAEAHEAACVLRVRDGQIIRARVMPSHDEAMALMGLRD